MARPLCHQDPGLPSPAEEWRDWAALPIDVLWLIFEKLPHTDILRGAELVCSPWRRLAVGEPLLWPRIDLAGIEDRIGHRAVGRRLRAMASAAVDRSAGACESFRGPFDAKFLPYLVNNAPSMRTLHVTSAVVLAARDVAGLIEKLPLLERIELSRGVFSFCVREVNDLLHARRRLRLFDTHIRYPSDAVQRCWLDRIDYVIANYDRLRFQQCDDDYPRRYAVEMPKRRGLRFKLVNFVKRLGRKL